MAGRNAPQWYGYTRPPGVYGIVCTMLTNIRSARVKALLALTWMAITLKLPADHTATILLTVS